MAQVGQQPYPGQQQQQPQYMTQNQNTQTTIFYTASGTPVQVINVNSNEKRYEHYQSSSARVLGILQIALGIIMVISQIVVTTLHFSGYQGMAGFYSPIFIILAGAFGVQSATTKSPCSVVTTMVMSIISSILSLPPVSQGFAGVLVTFSCSWEGDYENCESGLRMNTAIAFHAIMMIAGVIEFIVAICAAAYCCHGCCCHSRQQGVILNNGPGGAVVTPGVQMTTVAYTLNGSYPAPAPAPVSPGSYPHPTSAWPPYDRSTPPPHYQEKI